MNATLRLPVVRLLVHPLLGAALAGLLFCAGWFMRYSMEKGAGGATSLFAQRLFDAFSMRPPPPPPVPTPSASASPGTTATTSVPSVAPSVKPTPRRTIPPQDLTLKGEVLQFVAGLTELQTADRNGLKAKVSKWQAPGGADVIELCEAVDKLLYVKDPIRRGIVFRLLSLDMVVKELKLDPTKTDEIERLAKDWEIADLKDAFTKGGAPALKKLAAGRPAAFFVELRKKWPMYAVCRENLQALKEGKMRPDSGGGGTGASAAPGASPSPAADPSAPPAAECPAGGTYTKGPGGWACSVHQTLAQPFAEAGRLNWYIEPVEEAVKTAHTSGNLETALGIITEQLRLHPNHVWAVDAINELLFDAKSWAYLKQHLEKYIGKDPVNARWGYLLARASHETLDFDGAKHAAGRTQNASPNTLPPNIGRMQDFYILKDRALEIFHAASDKNRPEEYPFRKDEDQPSQACVRNLTEVKTAVTAFVNGYPGTHPDLVKLREKQQKAGELLKTTPPGPRLEAIKAKAKAIDDRVALINADTGGKMLWKALVKYLSGYQINSCPDGGRYTLERHQWLDCSRHAGILGDRLEWGKRQPPTTDEEVQLSRAILKGALAADPKRRTCFDMQRAYVAARGAEGVHPGEITTSTKLPDGNPLACPAGGTIEALATGATTARVRCSYHGSYEEYFEGVGEKEGP